MSKLGWTILFFGAIVFIGMLFIGVEALMCEPPCV